MGECPTREDRGIPKGAVWVRLPRFIGDSLMIHLALEPLRAADLPLVAWGSPLVVDLFRGSEAFQGVWVDGPERKNPLALRRLLKAHQAAAVLALGRSSRPLLAAWLARVPLRAGWGEGGGWLFANRHVTFRVRKGHQMENYRALLAKAFPQLPEAPFHPFRPRPEAQEAAERMAQQHGLNGGYVAFALGGMSHHKRLGPMLWAGLLRRLKAEGIPVVLLGAPGEDQVLAKSVLALESGAVDLTGQLGLAETAGLFVYARGVVGNDSALSHLGAACGIPTVVAFGPTLPEHTAPVGTRVRVVRKEDLSCLGCYGPRGCTVEGHPCMQSLEPERLWEALKEWL